MTFSIIQKSQLEGAQRIDAEYYQPEFLKVLKLLKTLKNKKLSEIAYITDGEHGSPIFDEQSGIKYFSAQHVKDFLIDSSTAKTISKIIDEKNKRSRLQKGDVLLSTVGTIGFAGLVTGDCLPANIDRHVARIALKENTMDPEVLTVFLNSKYGRFQTTREATGNVQLNLFIDKIKELIIPDLSKEDQVKNLFDEALDKLNQSKLYYQQAEDLLLEELGLKDFDKQNDLFSIVQYCDVIAVNRNDAEYFQPKYLRLHGKLKSKSQPLLKMIQNVPAKFEPAKEPGREFKYVELSNINSANGLIDGYETVLGKEAPSRARRVLKTGDVIVSSVEGSLEKVALVSEKQENYLASTGFFQFRSDKILPEALLIIMKSMVIQWQLKQHCAGTILTAVPGEALNKMYIPVLLSPIQQKIADLIRQSHAARQKSKELLDSAKRKVEEMIEKGGE